MTTGEHRLWNVLGLALGLLMLVGIDRLQTVAPVFEAAPLLGVTIHHTHEVHADSSVFYLVGLAAAGLVAAAWIRTQK